MNIQILDSWLRDYLETKAKPEKIAETLSLTSVSVEKIEKLDDDYLYDIEVTTNRPDLMSVIGIAREASVVLPQAGIEAKLKHINFSKPAIGTKQETIEIKNDPKLVNRICAVIMEIQLKDSPKNIQKRLESSNIRSLNNVIDVTNYVMREVGHPAHVFDFDRLTTKKLIIREAKHGEKIVTLDKKIHTLLGGDIVADNGGGEIVDLLGVMGTQNSVVTDQTKRILYFLDNNNPQKIRKTSMSLGIRTEAAVLNEKGVDPELMYDAFLRGIELFKEIADGKIISELIDIYPNKPKAITINISENKINSIIGIEIPLKKSAGILEKLGFEVKILESSLRVNVPSFRANDITIQEDLAEEIARVYGYHLLPSVLPQLQTNNSFHLSKNQFFWEKRAKDFLKYLGFTEVYTYSMVSEDMFEGAQNDAVSIQNPLNEEMVYMRRTLVPSLLQVLQENKNKDKIFIFEIANVYLKKEGHLPEEKFNLAGIIKTTETNFFKVKGVIESLIKDFGIKKVVWKEASAGGLGADIYIGEQFLGQIEILGENIIDFELDFDLLTKYASLSKKYKIIPKFPFVIEDIRLILPQKITYEETVKTIKKQSPLIASVDLFDVYNDKITLRITYQDLEKNLTTEDITPIRKKIFLTLKKELGVEEA